MRSSRFFRKRFRCKNHHALDIFSDFQTLDFCEMLIFAMGEVYLSIEGEIMGVPVLTVVQLRELGSHFHQGSGCSHDQQIAQQ